MKTRNVLLLTWLAAIVLGITVSGRWIYENIEGLDASAFPFGGPAHSLAEVFLGTLNNAVSGVVMGVLVLLVLVVVAFFWARSTARAKVAAVDPGRRGFLTGLASGVGASAGVAALGAGAAVARVGWGVGAGGKGWGNVTGPALRPETDMTHAEWLDKWKGARVQALRRLGRTEAMVSDISAGSGPTSGEKGTEIIRAAIDRGVNYIDTAPDYSASGSEQAVGKAIAGRRDDLFIATKFCTPIGHLPEGTPVAKYKEVIEGSLGRLGTDHVDLIHVHSCDSVGRVMDPNMHEAFDRLKEEGKARFLGFSTHTPNLEAVASAAIDSGRFDVMMLAYHFGAWKDMSKLIRRARDEQDMGVVAMKTLKGAKHDGLAGFREHSDAYSQAAFKWVLSNTDVSCLVISFRELQHVDEYLYASGGALSESDLAILREYDRQIAGTHCAPHCGDCLSSCPEGLPIHDVLRHRMYAEDYGHEKEGITRYAALEKNASVCASCSAPCLGSCPIGIDIPTRMRGAHELLSIG